MNTGTTVREKEIWELLESVMDPEVPVISIIDLGVVREIDYKDERCHIKITPTYSGCPAMQVIEDEICSTLKKNGIQNISIETVLSPAWTTDWLSENARAKLKAYGIAPPEKNTVDKNALFAKPKKIECPQCHSNNTEMVSQFGSTACKALYRCEDCLEPFDYFKCI